MAIFENIGNYHRNVVSTQFESIFSKSLSWIDLKFGIDQFGYKECDFEMGLDPRPNRT